MPGFRPVSAWIDPWDDARLCIHLLVQRTDPSCGKRHPPVEGKRWRPLLRSKLSVVDENLNWFLWTAVAIVCGGKVLELLMPSTRAVVYWLSTKILMASSFSAECAARIRSSRARKPVPVPSLTHTLTARWPSWANQLEGLRPVASLR